MTDGELIRLEREIQRDTEATQIRLTAVYCGLCGTRLIEGKCQHGCGETNHQQLNSRFYAESPALAIECPGCGETIHPAGEKMRGNWWMRQSRNWVYRCPHCGDGTLDELFQPVPAALNVGPSGPTFPDHEHCPDW